MRNSSNDTSKQLCCVVKHQKRRKKSTSSRAQHCWSCERRRLFLCYCAPFPRWFHSIPFGFSECKHKHWNSKHSQCEEERKSRRCRQKHSNTCAIPARCGRRRREKYQMCNSTTQHQTAEIHTVEEWTGIMLGECGGWAKQSAGNIQHKLDSFTIISHLRLYWWTLCCALSSLSYPTTQHIYTLCWEMGRE